MTLAEQFRALRPQDRREWWKKNKSALKAELNAPPPRAKNFWEIRAEREGAQAPRTGPQISAQGCARPDEFKLSPADIEFLGRCYKRLDDQGNPVPAVDPFTLQMLS